MRRSLDVGPYEEVGCKMQYIELPRHDVVEDAVKG